MTGGRLLIVSNRLPVALREERGEIRLMASSGGLATGLRSWRTASASVWIGWPGDTGALDAAQLEQLDRQLAGEGLAAVYLDRQEIERYYENFSNRVLWPLFHYQVDRVPVEASGWEAYRQVNEKFAQAVAKVYQPGDVVWVHDYQLMLVPAMLRERLPQAAIGFFLHIPFPASEVFRILPWRREVLRGLLGADLLGFHTFSYLRHFLTSLVHLEGIETRIDRVQLGNRTVRLGVFPMSVDVAGFETLARDPEVIDQAAAIRQDAGGRAILLGVDRLDYTKGIPRRLVAVERLLASDPALRDKVRLIQVAVPSRETVDSYQRFKRQVEESVGRINGLYATLRSVPVHYMHRSISTRQLAALYLAADVMLVTPLRDGMNLVAKEFVATRVDEDGVLVLSEFAGAAAELGDALLVNPYDVDAITRTLGEALAMIPDERRRRMQRMRQRLGEYDVHRWAEQFVTGLRDCESERAAQLTAAESLPGNVIRQMREASPLAIVLDYDGTLVPIAQAPHLARPDAALVPLLARLAGRPRTEVHVVSGRGRAEIDEWFAHLPLSLWAEHGFWFRPGDSREWQPSAEIPTASLERVYPILEQFAATTPGALVEKKTASVAWHYRMAEPQFGERQAHELRMMLGDALSNQPLEVLEGKKVIEVRLRGISKALAAQRLASSTAGALVVAFGDDRTDEELFAALPPESITVGVGGHVLAARHRVADHRAVRTALESLLSPWA
jgi:trehalose 6-phosphate synthase/phosphatase